MVNVATDERRATTSGTASAASPTRSPRRRRAARLLDHQLRRVFEHHPPAHEVEPRRGRGEGTS
jgi:hypothetical protein